MTQGLGAGGRQYKGIVDCVSQIVQQEGAGAMFKGVGPRVMWISIGGSVFFVALEQAKKYFVPGSATASHH